MVRENQHEQSRPHKFAERMHRECSLTPDLHEVFEAEKELGDRSVSYVLSRPGFFRLLRAHERDATAKQAAKLRA